MAPGPGTHSLSPSSRWNVPSCSHIAFPLTVSPSQQYWLKTKTLGDFHTHTGLVRNRLQIFLFFSAQKKVWGASRLSLGKKFLSLVVKSNLRQKTPFSVFYCSCNGQNPAATHDPVFGSIWWESYKSCDFEKTDYQDFSVTSKPRLLGEDCSSFLHDDSDWSNHASLAVTRSLFSQQRKRTRNFVKYPFVNKHSYSQIQFAWAPATCITSVVLYGLVLDLLLFLWITWFDLEAFQVKFLGECTQKTTIS